MAKRNISKHTLNLREGDYDKLRDAFPDVGAAVIIRRIVSKFVDELDRGMTPTNLQIGASVDD